jgi:hypothetical protein
VSGGGGGGGGGATFFARRTMISFSSVKNYVSLQPFLRKILTPLISFSSIIKSTNVYIYLQVEGHLHFSSSAAISSNNSDNTHITVVTTKLIPTQCTNFSTNKFTVIGP